MEKFVTGIKKKYRERLINREKQWPPCHTNKLIQLQLVEREKGEDYSTNQLRGREDKTVKRTPLAYGDLLMVESGKKPVRKVLVEGDAGIGKTTLCTSVSEDWADEKIFQQFELLLLLPLRQKEVASAGSLPELFKLLHSSESICNSVASYLEEEEGEKVLIVADGWDELGESERLEGSFIHKLLFQSFPLLSVVVTSRPSISAPLHRFPYIDRFVEVHGFNKENMKEYIESEFISDKEKADRLLEQLEYNPLVGSVCSVPLNCAIVCHLWRTLEEALPTTMTELYTKIVLNIILRNIHKVDMYNTVLSLPNFDALPGGLQRSWRLLCEFAYQALEKDHIVFSQRELDDFFPQGLGSILCFGLLQSAESIFETGCGVSFHFLHLSFQEYLAALHLVMQHQDTLVKIIQSHNSELAPLERTNFDISSLAKNANLNTKSKRFIMVWRFVFGILHVSQEWKKNNLDIKQVIKHLSDIRTHSYHSLLLCHCAFEARNITINKEVIHSLGKYSFITTGIMFSNATIIDFGHPQTAHDCAAVIYVISNMQECGCIVINFDNSGIRESQIRALTDVLASKHGKLQIKRIGLSGNKLTDKSVSDLFYRASAAFNSPDSINLSNNRIGVESIGSVVAKPYNRSLVLSHNPLGVHGLQKLEGAVCDGSLANLQELYLDGSLTSDADTNGKLLATFVEALLVHCPCLALLDLSQNNLGVPGASAFARGISQDKSHGSVTAGILHSMQICKINYILLSKTKLDLTAFVKSLVGPCHFWKLVLNDNDVRATGVSCLADGICSGKIVIERSMSEIYLHGNPLGLEGTVAIGRMISSSHCQLWGLSLSRCQLTTTGGGLPNTDSLNVDNNATIGKKVRDVGLQLCQMPQSSTITRLYLDDNSFTGEGVHILVGFMHLCPYLKQLSLHHCGITSDDLRQLLDQLTKLKSSSPYHCSKLESWDLSHNGIDDSGVSVLIDHLPLLFPRLTHLDCCAVDNNPVSSEMIRRLKEEMKRHQEVKCFVKSPPSPLPPPQDKDIENLGSSSESHSLTGQHERLSAPTLLPAGKDVKQLQSPGGMENAGESPASQKGGMAVNQGSMDNGAIENLQHKVMKGHCALTEDDLAPMANLQVKPKHVDRLLAVLAEVAANWIVFMGQLEFPQAQIKQIERDIPQGDHRSVECLRIALLHWVANSDNPTYGVIISALSGPILNEAVLAQRVEEFSQRIQDVLGPDAAQFDVNMTAEELCELLKAKGVDDEDCASFRKNKVNGRAFSKMKLSHVERISVSFGSRIIIESLLEEIGGDVSGSYGARGGGAQADPEWLPNDPIWDEVPTLGYLQLLKWYDNENKRHDLRLLRNLAPVWDKTAETLHLSGAEIKIIERNNSGDQSGRIREVVVKWLSNGSMLPESGRYPVNWRGFFHLLLDVEQGDMADALKSALSACKSNIRRTFY